MLKIFPLILFLPFFLASCDDDGGSADGDIEEQDVETLEGEMPNGDSEFEMEEEAEAVDYETVYIAPGCEDMLISTDDPLNKGGSHEEYIARFHAARESEDAFNWNLRVLSLRVIRSPGKEDRYHYFTNEELELRDRCIREALDEARLFDANIDGYVNFVKLKEEKFSIVEPFLRLTVIEYAQPGCFEKSESELCECLGRNEKGCDLSPFCYPMFGSPYDEERECLYSDVFIECNQGCPGGDIPTMALGPDGTCYLFSGTCTPYSDGWERHSSTGRCSGWHSNGPCE